MPGNRLDQTGVDSCGYEIPSESDLIRRVMEVKQNTIAEATGLSTSQVNMIVAGTRGITISHLCPFLAALGYDITEAKNNTITVDRDEFLAMRVLARKALESNQ